MVEYYEITTRMNRAVFKTQLNKIIDLLKKEELTIQQIATKLNRSYTPVRELISRLVFDQKIERTNEGTYKIK